MGRFKLAVVTFEWDDRKAVKETSTQRATDELRPQYDLSKLGPGVRGKYLKRAEAGSNVVSIEPDLAASFPDAV